MIPINHNELIYNDKVFKFEHEILEYAVIHNKILIVFRPNHSAYSNNNVECFSLEQKLLWKIKDVPQKFGGGKQYPYAGISLYDNKCSVVDFYGRRFTLDMETGEIIDKDIVK